MTRNTAHAWANMNTAPRLQAVGPAPGFTEFDAVDLHDEALRYLLDLMDGVRSTRPERVAAESLLSSLEEANDNALAGRWVVTFGGVDYRDRRSLMAGIDNAVELAVGGAL